MDFLTPQYLNNWLDSLDAQIGDTQKEIEKRRRLNSSSVSVREDVKDLIEYIENNDMPQSVCRALDYCLGWNPFAKAKKI